MLYIIIALKAEAQAFIDKYKLTKENLGKYPFYHNDTMKIIISGVGVENSMFATQTLINHFDITDDDIYLNVGVCGAEENFKLGELIEIGSIEYQENLFSLNNNSTHTIKCVQDEVSSNIAKIVDMESFGFFEAVRHSPAIKNYHILKVVSDHFKPHSLTKDMVKSLIFNQLDAINTIIKPKETL